MTGGAPGISEIRLHDLLTRTEVHLPIETQSGHRCLTISVQDLLLWESNTAVREYLSADILGVQTHRFANGDIHLQASFRARQNPVFSQGSFISVKEALDAVPST